MVLRLPLESHWRGRESHVARNAISISILELLWRVHCVAAGRSGVRVPEKLLQTGLRNALLNCVNSEGVPRILNGRRNDDASGLTDEAPGLSGGPVREREHSRLRRHRDAVNVGSQERHNVSALSQRHATDSSGWRTGGLSCRMTLN